MQKYHNHKNHNHKNSFSEHGRRTTIPFPGVGGGFRSIPIQSSIEHVPGAFSFAAKPTGKTTGEDVAETFSFATNAPNSIFRFGLKN